jgi:signal transduction histidine kinase
LTQARVDAERANRAKSDFLAMMSHELRTPMNGVLGMLQLLETTRMTEEQAEYSALAAESTEHLLKVINDILDFSRIERNALEMENIAFNLAELINSSTQAFQHNAQQRGLSLHLDLQTGLDAFNVCGDPTRLRQILVNLIGNALDAMQAQPLPVLWLEGDLFEGRYRLRVRDNGHGIDAEARKHLFEPFFTTKPGEQGLGLGLTLSASLAAAAGGSLNAEDPAEGGTMFVLMLPLVNSGAHTA